MLEINSQTFICKNLSIAFLFSVCHAQEKLELKDRKDKESYSLGYQFGYNLRVQGVDLDLEVYNSGIKGALAGKEPKMSQEDIRSTIMGLQQRLQATREKELKEMTAKNFEEGKKFLAENQKLEGSRMKVMTPRDLKIRSGCLLFLLFAVNFSIVSVLVQIRPQFTDLL